MPATEQQLWVTYKQGPRRCGAPGFALRFLIPRRQSFRSHPTLATPSAHCSLAGAVLGAQPDLAVQGDTSQWRWTAGARNRGGTSELPSPRAGSLA